jgi:hypothetical protein
VTRLQELERRLAEEPENLGLRVAVAEALRDAGRHADAVELYRSAAIAYRDEGRAQQAIAACRSLLEIAPDDARGRALHAALDGEAAPRASAASLADEPEEVTARRSWSEDTPLPPALPYHVADPTSRLRRISESDLPTSEDAPTRPGSSDSLLPQVSGIANAARRISASLIAAHVSSDDEEISIDIEADEPEPLGSSPGAVPHARDDDDDDQTQPRDLPLGLRRSWTPADTRGLVAAALGGGAVSGPLGFAFFAPLPAERRAAVLARFSRRSVPPGTVVIRQGEVGPSFVLVASGQLEVRADRAGRTIDLGAIGPGEHIGEAPLLARAPARGSVVAATEAELLLLSPRDFYDIAGTFPALWAELKALAERRTREHDARVS